MLRALSILSRNSCTIGAKTIQSTNVHPFRGRMRLSYSNVTSWPQNHDLKELEAKATAGSLEDMLKLGRIHFEEQRRDEAELWLSKAAKNDSIEAQFLTGMLLISTSAAAPMSAEKEASNKAEVKDQIMKLRKESMFAKRSQASNLDDFQAALKKRKEKLAQQQQPQATVVPADTKLSATPSSVLTKNLDSRALGLEWLQRAALAGHGQAMCLLGNELLSESQKIVNGEPSKEKKVPDVAHAEQLVHQAISWYQLAATEGKVGAAAYNLGVMYHDGVQHSLPKSTVTKAPGQDASPDVSSLADLMVTKVVHKKGAATVEVTQSATIPASTGASINTADELSGNPSNQLVTIVPVDLDASLSYFQQAAALGESAASLWCGYCYSTGEGGVAEIDADKAVQYLLEASNPAQENSKRVILGSSDRTASEKESEAQTAAKANYYLSQIYLSGLDEQLVPDRAKSLHYLQLAVAGDDEDGVHTLADLHLQRHLKLESQLASAHLAADVDKEETEGSGEVEEEVEKLELNFLEKDLLQALQQEAAAAVATVSHRAEKKVSDSAPHVHSDSCGSTCGHNHNHNHDHHHHDHQHNHSSEQGHVPQDLSTDSSVEELPVGAELSKQNLLRAVKLLVQASAAGQAEATLTLGALTYQGLLPPQRDEEGNVINNKRRAFEFYQLAAEQGSLDAWRNLASMHYLGDGVPKSVDLAKEIMKVVFGKK